MEAIAFDAIGHMVTESNGTVRVWDSQNGAPRDAASVTARRFLSGADGVSRESFRESPRWQLTMSGTTVSVVDRSTGREVGRLPSNGFAVGAVASPDGTRVATGDDEGVVRVWEPIATAGVTLQHDTPIGAAAVNSDCSLVVTSTGHGVRVWDVGTGRERRRLLGELAIGRLVISPDGSVIASARGGYDGQPDSVVIASVTSGETLRRIPVPAAVRELAFSADSKTLIMTTEHTFGTLRVSSGSAVRSFTEDDEIAFIAINRDGQTLALASGNRVSLWDVASGQRGVTLPFIGVVTQMAFSSDGTLATMSGSGVRLWNVSNRAERPLLHDDIVRGVAFDPRAPRLVTFTNTRARVWSMDGVMRADLPHNEMVVAAAVAGGDIVATLTKSAVHVWSTDTAHELATIPMNEELESLWLSPDGRVVSVGVGGRMVRILRWRSDDIMNELCRRLTRNMNEKDWTARFPGEVYRRSCAQLPPGTIR